MDKHTLSSRLAVALLLLAVMLALAVPGLAQDAPDGRPSPSLNVNTNLRSLKQEFQDAITQPDGRIQVIVQLADAPAVSAFSAAGGRANRAAADLAARAQRQVVASAQAQFASAAAAYGASRISATQYLVNTVTLAIPANNVAALRAMPGVLRVQANGRVERQDTLIPGDLKVGAAWGPEGGTDGLTGKGLVVAVIDDGIDYTHTHFGGAGDYSIVTDDTIIEPALEGIFPAPFPIVDQGDPKIVGGYDFVGNDFVGSNAPVPDPNPLTCDGATFIAHGTSASSFIGGWGVNADGSTYTGPYDDTILTDYPQPTSAFRVGPGLAPWVAITGLRIFGCDGFTSDALIVAAIEAAVAGEVDVDGNPETEDSVTFPAADVINMSLGAPYNQGAEEGGIEDLAIDAAVEAGVIVVASAGNNYDNHYVTGSPAASNSSISVAATINYGNKFGIVRNGEEVAKYLAFPGSAGPATDVTAAWVIAQPASPCAGLTNAADAAGKIVVVFFNGSCGTSVLGDAVEAANGVGMLVVGTFGIFGSDLVPSMGTSNELWAAAAEVLLPTDQLSLVNSEFDTQLLGITDFSSRGPARNAEGFLKPDLAAPGESGVAASGGSGDGTTLFGGTSQAAPVVAGVMTLLREKYPDATVQQLKALAINAANVDLSDIIFGSDAKYGMQRQGTGRANIPPALNSPVIAYNKADPIGVSVSFGQIDVNPGRTLNQSRVVTIENLTNRAVTYRLKVVTRNNMPGVRFQVAPNSVTVPRNGKVDVRVRLTGSPNVPNGGRITDPTLYLVDGSRYYQTEETGFLELTSPGNPKLRLALYAAPRPTAAVKAKSDTISVNSLVGTAGIPLGGPGVNTGPNLPDDIISLVSAFDLLATSENDPDIADDGDLQYAGFASNPLTGYGYFALATYGDWEPPIENFIEVAIDSDQDGLTDWVLTQCFDGDYFDDLQICFIDVQNALGLGAGALLSSSDFPGYQNDTLPSVANTYVFNTNVLVYAYPLYVFDNFLDDTNTAFDFVISESSLDSLDDGVVGPFTADWNRPAVSPASPASETMPLSVARNNGAAEFAYNFPEPGEYDVLLIHHHNGGAANRAEVVTVNVIGEDGFKLVGPANNGLVRGSVDVASWEDFGSDTYTFTLIQVSGNALAMSGERLGVTELVGTAAPFDGDDLDCYAALCQLDLSAVALEDGLYTWTVTSGGEIAAPLGLDGTANIDGVEASNGPFSFTVNNGSFALLTNGGFEQDGNNDGIPNAWRRTGPGAQRCRPGDADTGDCAYFIRGNGRINAGLSQSVKPALLAQLGIGSGDTLVLSARVKTNNLASGASVKVTVRYTTGEPTVLDVPLPQTTDGSYVDLQLPITLDGASNEVDVARAVKNIAVRIGYKNTAATGNLFIDNVALTLLGTGDAPDLVAQEGPLGLPAAPTDLRGN